MDKIKKNRTILKEKTLEALMSVVPITAIVLVLCFTLTPVPAGMFLAFIIGAVMLIVGMGFFTLGAETAMSPIGERVGAHMTKSKNLFLIVAISFALGVMITVSEPDLQVLASQVPTIPNAVLVWAVAAGVGAFLVITLLRIIFSVKLSYLLMGLYAVVFILAIFAPQEFWAIAFDSGGVTTGPMTVPFIMALGVGVASIRSDVHAEEDSFGLVAVCSVGPVLALLVLGFIFPTDVPYVAADFPVAENTRAIGQLFGSEIPFYFKEVSIALLPIIAFFLIYNLLALKLHKRPLIKIIVGLVYTYLGLTLFLTGVNVGFMPVGSYIGAALGALPFRWILIPIAMIMGFFIIDAEPAVHVLNKQVEDITSGAISPKVMKLSLSIGVSISLGLTMIRVLTGLSIMWFLIPGYIIAFALTFFVPPIFTAIAFDSGGIASGPMTATFLLPFAMGASGAVGGNVVTDAFGIVAMVAMTPLITIQIMGLVYKYFLNISVGNEANIRPDLNSDTDIIEL